MKLYKQTRLHFQEGASDKVYEADICEVGTDQYVVNFRYGRRGGNLSEGSKTTSPVPLVKAQQIFDKLIEEKTKKGYVDVSEGSISEQGQQIEAVAEKIKYDSPEAARKGQVLLNLELAIRSLDLQSKKRWDIKRVVWRAGELKLAEATPHLIRLSSLAQLGKRKNDLYKYCIIWAIGRCAPESAFEKEALDMLDALIKDTETTPMSKRMASEAYLNIASGETRKAFLDSVLAGLNPKMQEAINSNNWRSVRTAINDLKSTISSSMLLQNLYLLAAEQGHVKEALVDFLQSLPIQANYFQAIRHLFKAAEFRQDGQVFGLLAYRIEKQSPLFRMPTGENAGMYFNRQYIYPKSELKKADSKVAFSDATKSYLQRRIRRSMKRVGELNDLNYVLMATGILLQYDDQRDGKTARTSKDWKYDNKEQRWHSAISYFDSYSKELLFNEILYGNSKRYAFSKKQEEWVCVNGYLPGAEIDINEREEAFPHLWDQMPKALIHLLVECKSEKVSDFALRSFQRHPQYKQLLARFDVNLVIRLLEKTFTSANLFALDLAKQYYNPEKPDYKLVLTMLNHSNNQVRAQSLKWISESFYTFFADTDFVRDLLTHPAAQVRQWARENFDRMADLYDEPKRRALIGRLIGFIVHQAKDDSMITEISNSLTKYFAEELSTISLDVVGELLQHKLMAAQDFGASLLKGHALDIDRIPMDYILLMVNSHRNNFRQMGLELFSSLSDPLLAKQQELLFSLAISPNAEIRTALQIVIGRLAAKFDDFSEAMVQKIIRMLLRKEPFEGLHQVVYNLLTNELARSLHIIERPLIFRLLNSDHSKAQEMACVLVERYIPFNTMSVRNMIRLADHEILQARELAWKMFKDQLPRVKYEREEAVRLMDANWEDTRQFAFEFFRKEFTKEDWSPELLVAICDSVRLDVQGFGRELIARYFEEQDGPDYLMKLSQHPRAELQLFATNYLERFASGQIKRLENLEMFFITVLSNVNKGRVAKDRILAFLHKEALKSYEAAVLVARIVDRISAASLIGDRNTCIEIMRDIQQKYPVIELPIQVQDFPHYSEV